ncbi:transposase [Candidatus Borrarchaeum sp.]|uniref:RNA-guided endonuclease InsQ/TnpB family protein n=1 Tax=Candidatus Borrarchaeum sp. TaxID=2846742 RepID=UPI0025811BC7|nr:transposase [Candidatus Borrarchaeum sp.]
MNLTQQIRIFPTLEQEEVLWKLSEKCRLIYNFALAERQHAYRYGITGVNYRKQQNDLPAIKQRYPEYCWVYSKVLQYVLRALAADYASFFALNKHGRANARPPRFKGKNYFTTMIYNQSGFKLEQDSISFSHKCNNIPLEFVIPEKFSFLNDTQITQVAIFKKHAQYFIAITYEVKEPAYVDNGRYQAIDLGITNIVTAVNTSGKFLVVKNQRPDKYWNPKIAKIQARRDHCKKYSQRWNYLNAIKRKYERKRDHQLKDFQHKLSKKLVENTRANTIIVGDLNVKGMAQSRKVPTHIRKGLHRATQNTGSLGRFVQFLTYKSNRVGKRLIEFDERNSSRECYMCGKLHEMPIWQRVMICECGNVIARDKNSCVVIMKRYLSQNAKWTGYQDFLDNLRHTANGKTKVPSPIIGHGSEDSQEAPSVRVE